MIKLKVLGIIIGVIIILALVGMFYGWLIMLGVGITHSVWNWPTSTIGLWPSAFGLGLISMFFLTGANAAGRQQRP
jgi:hypothetical protein